MTATAPPPVVTAGLDYVRWADTPDPEGLSRALFQGQLVVFEARESVARIRARAQILVQTTFDGTHPERTEAALAPAAFRKTAVAARRAVQDDAELDRLWLACTADIGYAPADLHRDRLRLRVVPALGATDGRIVRPLPPHRDSWASGIAAQVNWWMPLYPLAADRTMVIWPEWFDHAVPNTAAAWDYDRALATRGADYPLLPEALAPPPTPGRPVLIEPGTMLAFSAAHLHASVRHGADRPRFSLDTRTVWHADVAAGRGAPDVDGAGKPERSRSRSRWDMFDRPALPKAPAPGETT